MTSDIHHIYMKCYYFSNLKNEMNMNYHTISDKGTLLHSPDLDDTLPYRHDPDEDHSASELLSLMMGKTPQSKYK